MSRISGMRLHSLRMLAFLATMGLSACASGPGTEKQATVSQAETSRPPQGVSEVSRQADAQSASRNQRKVVINETLLADEVVRGLEMKYGVQFRDGRYWYDKVSGAWGLEGGPCVGIGVPGLEVAGPLRHNASNGNTRIFINGRELHMQEAIGIQSALGIPPQPGRYFWDAYGNVGSEGGPILFNVRQVLAARGASQGAGAWSHHSAYGPTSSGSSVGGDGQGFFYYQDGKTSYSIGN